MDFWSDVHSWSSNTFQAFFWEILWETKVYDLYIPVLSDKNVVRFQVSMSYALAVDGTYCFKDLLHNILDLILSEVAFLPYLQYLWVVLHKLLDKVVAILCDEDVKDLYDIRMLYFTNVLQLSFEKNFLKFWVFLDSFYSYFLWVIISYIAFIDHSECSRA